MKLSEKWWWPKEVDVNTVLRLRSDYPEESYMSNGDLLKRFGYDGHKYEAAGLWDHIGDAETDYDRLADALIQLERKLAKADALAEAAQNIYNATKFEGEKQCIHGIGAGYPVHGWWCDDCFFGLRDALAAYREET